MTRKRFYCDECGEELVDKCYLRIWACDESEMEEDILCDLQKSNANGDLEPISEDGSTIDRELLCGQCFQEGVLFGDIR